MDKIDLFDEDRRSTGKVIYGKNYIPDGMFYITSHIWIQNNNGKYLIQQRSDSVNKLKNMWGTTSGTVIWGETSRQGAKRECFEELGVIIAEEKLCLLLTYKSDKHFVDVWRVKDDIPLDSITLQQSEVASVKYADEQEIYDMINQNKFYKYRYLDMLFTMYRD